MKTSNDDNTPLSRRDFVRAASLAATAVASSIGLAAARGQTSSIDDTRESLPSPATQSRDLEPGTGPIQAEGPLAAIDAHVCGLHFYSGDLSRQVIAHHYCSHVSKSVRQCVIYDSDKKHARLVGVEYVIASELFEALPAEEKKLWHSHVYEVKSGQLTAPGIPATAEMELMKGFVGTYGKTWYTWPVDCSDEVPLGVPGLMMAFTADGQASPKLLADRDREYGISSEEKKRSRAGIVAPAIQPGADAWQKVRS